MGTGDHPEMVAEMRAAREQVIRQLGLAAEGEEEKLIERVADRFPRMPFTPLPTTPPPSVSILPACG